MYNLIFTVRHDSIAVGTRVAAARPAVLQLLLTGSAGRRRPSNSPLCLNEANLNGRPFTVITIYLSGKQMSQLLSSHSTT